MRRTTLAATLAAGLLALTACTEPPAARSASTTPPPSSTSPTSSPTPEPTTPTPRAFGSVYAWESTADGVSGTTAVLGYKQGVRSVGSAAEESGTPGYVWAAVELKVCSTKGTFLGSTEPWTLSYADGARIEPSSTTYDDFPKPEFPFETKLTTGKCVRGNLVFPVPGNSRPQTIVYAPQGLDIPEEWTVPAK